MKVALKVIRRKVNVHIVGHNSYVHIYLVSVVPFMFLLFFL